MFAGCQYRIILQGHPVLPGLQAHAAERLAASVDASSRSYASCQLLPQGKQLDVIKLLTDKIAPMPTLTSKQ